MAERVGFEPTVPFWGTRHFQCRQFSRSCTFPLLIRPAKQIDNRQKSYFRIISRAEIILQLSRQSLSPALPPLPVSVAALLPRSSTCIDNRREALPGSEQSKTSKAVVRAMGPYKSQQKQPVQYFVPDLPRYLLPGSKLSG